MASDRSNEWVSGGHVVGLWLRMNAFRRLAVVVVATLAFGAMASAPLSAHAADPATALASDNPYNWTPRVLDGQVDAVKRVGDTVFVGGSFTQIQAPDDASPILSRPYLFAFDARTGTILDSFAATPSGPVKVIVPNSAGTQL